MSKKILVKSEVERVIKSQGCNPSYDKNQRIMYIFGEKAYICVNILKSLAGSIPFELKAKPINI